MTKQEYFEWCFFNSCENIYSGCVQDGDLDVVAYLSVGHSTRSSTHAHQDDNYVLFCTQHMYIWVYN